MPMLDETIDMVAIAKRSLGLQEAIPPAAPADAAAIGSGCDGNRAPESITAEADYGRSLLLQAAAYDCMARYHELMLLADRATPDFLFCSDRASNEEHHKALIAEWKQMAEGRREEARKRGCHVPAPCMSGFIAAVGGRL